MAIFTFLATTQFWAGITASLGLSATVANAVIAVGQAAAWGLASAMLGGPKLPRQQVQATLTQTDGPRIRAYGRNLLGGQRAFFEAKNGVLHQIIVAHHGRVDGLISLYIDGERAILDGSGNVLNSPIAPDMSMFFRDGSGPGGAYAEVTAAFPTLWTAAHRLDGQATFMARMYNPGAEQFGEVWPKGAYTILQAEVRASRVRNMAGASVYSENAGLCIRDLMTHADGWNIQQARLDPASWGQFVGLCDQPVPLAGGGTEPRYRLCGFYTLEDPLKDVTARMLQACDGQIFEDAAGRIGILGGAWSVPDVTITAQDILSIKMQDGRDPFTDYNILNGSFVSPAHGYQSTSVAPIKDAAALAEQEERHDQLDVEMCPSGAQLQRLMKIKMAKDRREHIGTIRTNLVGMKARFPKGDGIHTVRIVAEEFGLDGVFEVTSHVFSIPDGFCEIGIASIANPYGWNAATEEKPLPPGLDDIALPEHSMPPVTGISLTQEAVIVSGDVRGVRFAVKVSDPGRRDLELQAQVARGTYAANGPWSNPQPVWTEMPAASFRAETGLLDDGSAYTVRVRWRRSATWTLAGTLTATANPVAPDAPTEFGATVTGTTVYLDWINAPSNFWRTQVWRGTSGSFGSASLIKTVSGNAGQSSFYTDGGPLTPLPSGTYYYWVVTLNPSSVASVPSARRTVTI